MPVLQLDDKQFPLPAGATRIGAGAGMDVAVPGDPALGLVAVIDGGSAPVIRRASDSAQVRVNGMLLGAEPTPLMHGDKVEIGGVELRYADDAKAGATQFVSASDIAAMTGGTKRAGAARETAASGGRLVSLVDGKEYTVPSAGLVVGREASCDVVVAQNEVSRRHAEIAPGEQGYLVRDMSANGVFVNGERVQGSHRLARADVLRIGSEEFRFYADVLAPVASAVVPAVAPAPEPVVALASAPAAVLAAAPSLPASPEPVVALSSAPLELAAAPASPRVETPADRPTVPVMVPDTSAAVEQPREDPRPVVATLESLNEGPLKGTMYELRSELAHVGRGGHNDVRLGDESVSETHAKLQRRDDGWYVVDMESTNGTYVGGSRVKGERRLDGSPDVRFGGMKMRFTAAKADVVSDVEAKGTRAIAAVDRRPSSMASPPPQTPVPAASVESTTKSARSGWIWLGVALVIAGVAFYVLGGGA